MPTLTVRRDKGWTDKFRKYRILVDGEEIGRLGEGEHLCHPIAAGVHVVEAKIDWCGSRPLRLEIGTEDQLVVVRGALRGWRLLFAGFRVFLNQHEYLTLELVDGEAD